MIKSIAVAGKGGTGKSTIAALIINCLLKKNNGPILAIDADPDANLGYLLGIEVEKTLGDAREEMLQEIKDFPPGMDKSQYIESGLHQVIEEAKGFDLLTMGRGEGTGCYCYLNSMVRKFADNLIPLYRWIVMDNEAGLEHISRKTTSNVDVLFVVVNENPLSIATARSIEKITKDMIKEIGAKYIITNKVKPERLDKIKIAISNIDIEYIGDIPQDSLLDEMIFNGKSLLDIEESPSLSSICKIIDTVLNKETLKV